MSNLNTNFDTTPRFLLADPAGAACRAVGLVCPAAQMPGKSSRRKSLPSQLPEAAIDYGESLTRGGQSKPADLEALEQATCASGSTWARMSKHALTKHVLAMGERLGVSEGMRVLDVGATCGHALARPLQASQAAPL